MPDIRLKELLEKYLEGRATPEEAELVEDWYAEIADEQEVNLSETERAELRNAYWNSLKNEVHSRPRTYYIWRSLAIAASVSAILLVAFVLIRKDRHHADSQADLMPSAVFQVIDNTGVAVREFKLPDSSTVRLWPGSQIRVLDAFNVNNRTIALSGEASFDVSRNERKPFLVISNEVVTTVLGTSFTITAYPHQEEITVAVKSGRVSVSASKKEHGSSSREDIVLIPNQQAVYSRHLGTVSRTLVKEPEVIIPAEEVNKIRFEGVAIAEIFRTLEKMYGVEIQFSEEAFASCTMTTSAKGKDLYQWIDVICEIADARYVVDDGRIVVSGSGCK